MEGTFGCAIACSAKLKGGESDEINSWLLLFMALERALCKFDAIEA
jgi:hypothetical protein